VKNNTIPLGARKLLVGQHEWHLTFKRPTLIIHKVCLSENQIQPGIVVATITVWVEYMSTRLAINVTCQREWKSASDRPLAVVTASKRPQAFHFANT